MNSRRLEALRAMARADESPHERDVARAVLQEAGEGWDEPPKRPPAAPAPPSPWPRSPNVIVVTYRGTASTTGNFIWGWRSCGSNL